MIEYVNKVGVELVDYLASDNMVAMAAWVSHSMDSEERLDDQAKVKGLINFLYRNKHMSPFEHGTFIWKVDVPLFVAREFQRHRTFSYNEVSGRYTKMKPRFWRGDTARVQNGKPGDYYFEPGTDEQTALYRRKKEQRLETYWRDYQDLLDAGIAKEQAREDMPLSMMTQFYATSNPRNLMQFLTLRNEKHALQEIQAVAVQMEDIFAQKMPFTYGAYASARAAEREPLTTGDIVSRGQVIGESGGGSGKPHIQYEVHVNPPTSDVDPKAIAREIHRHSNMLRGRERR